MRTREGVCVCVWACVGVGVLCWFGGMCGCGCVWEGRVCVRVFYVGLDARQ